MIKGNAVKAVIMVEALDLARERKESKKWEPEFDAILEEYYGEVSAGDLQEYFAQQGKNFTKQKIYKRAFELGLTGK